MLDMHGNHSMPLRVGSMVLAVVIAWFVSVIHTTSAQSGDFAVPSTISSQAQDALAKFSRAAATALLLEPGDIAAWKKVQA